MNEQFYIGLACRKISVQCSYSYSHELCRDYLIPKQPVELNIMVTENEVMQEANSSPGFDVGYLESLCLFRKIAERLPQLGSMVVHGAAITYGSKAFLFTAPSGTGKSTHIALWKKYLGDAVDIINGDKPILSVDERKVIVYGTPWGGKEGWQKNRSAELHGICILKQGVGNQIHGLQPDKCLNGILRQVYMPRDEESAAITLKLLDLLLRKIPVYLMECDISETAVRCSFETMTGKSFNKAISHMTGE